MDDIEMARPKGLLILFTSFKMLDILPDSEFRHVVNAMRAYVETGSEPEGLELVEQVAFESQREAMNGSIETYQRSIFANRQNGKKGGRPRKATETDGIAEEPTETHGFSEKPTETDKTYNKNKNNNNSDTKVSDDIVVVKQTDADLARIVQQYEAVIGTFPRSALDKLQGWREVFRTEMILLAINKAAESGNRSWSYISGILSNWQHSGVHTPGDAAASDEQWQNRKQGGKSGNPGGKKKAAENVAEAYANIFKGVK